MPKFVITILVWLLLANIVVGPMLVAAFSPLQSSRNVAYIIGGMSGIVALALLLVQPLLAAGYLPGVRVTQLRRWHRLIGVGIIVTVLLHIIGLYLTSPDDMSDALLLVAPTPFSVYGVIGLWSLVLTAFLVATRKRIRFGDIIWRTLHNWLAVIVVVASVVHALMIEGAMGYKSKWVLCICILAATAIVTVHLRFVKPFLKKRS